MDWNLIIAVLAGAGTVLGAVWGLAIWLSKQFSAIRDLVYSRTEQIKNVILNKLEYHERHDDQRFATIATDLNKRFEAVTDDVWDIRVRNAARDGLIVPKDKS